MGRKSHVNKAIGLTAVLVMITGLIFGCYSREVAPEVKNIYGQNIKPRPLSEDELRQFARSVRKVDGEAEAHYKMALYFQDRHREKLAIDELKQVLKRDPASAKAYNAIGVSCDNLGDNDTAIAYYRQALQIDANLDYVYNNLGYSYLLKKDMQNAVDSFQHAISLNGKEKRYRNNLGLAFAKQGQYALAFNQFKALDSDVNAEKMLARVMKDIGKGAEVDAVLMAVRNAPKTEDLASKDSDCTEVQAQSGTIGVQESKIPADTVAEVKPEAPMNAVAEVSTDVQQHAGTELKAEVPKSVVAEVKPETVNVPVINIPPAVQALQKPEEVQVAVAQPLVDRTDAKNSTKKDPAAEVKPETPRNVVSEVPKSVVAEAKPEVPKNIDVQVKLEVPQNAVPEVKPEAPKNALAEVKTEAQQHALAEVKSEAPKSVVAELKPETVNVAVINIPPAVQAPQKPEEVQVAVAQPLVDRTDAKNSIKKDPAAEVKPETPRNVVAEVPKSVVAEAKPEVPQNVDVQVKPEVPQKAALAVRPEVPKAVVAEAKPQASWNINAEAKPITSQNAVVEVKPEAPMSVVAEVKTEIPAAPVASVALSAPARQKTEEVQVAAVKPLDAKPDTKPVIAENVKSNPDSVLAISHHSEADNPAPGLSTIQVHAVKVLGPSTSTQTGVSQVAHDKAASTRQIEIAVENGNGVKGAAGRVAELLRRKGFKVVKVSDARSFDHFNTKVFFESDDLKEVQQLLRVIPESPYSAELYKMDKVGPPPVRLLVGKDMVKKEKALARGKKAAPSKATTVANESRAPNHKKKKA